MTRDGNNVINGLKECVKKSPCPWQCTKKIKYNNTSKCEPSINAWRLLILLTNPKKLNDRI